MADIYVISDTHFNHSNIIKYCNRPFTHSEEMDERIIENWNSVVKDQDKVYHLGDVYFGGGRDGYIQKLLSRLKGKKRLILGNHDNGKDQILQRAFQKIDVWRMFPEFGLLLTHVPVHKSSLFRGMKDRPTDLTKVMMEKEESYLKNVHGHIHDKDAPSKDHINVSVERINYTPVNIESLRIR